MCADERGRWAFPFSRTAHVLKQKMKKHLFVLLSFGLAFLSSLQAQTVIDNSSFEIGSSDPANSVIAVAANSTILSRWTVKSAGVIYLGTIQTASEGKRSVHLNFSAPGAIEQAFNSVPQQGYRVYFDYSAYVGPTGAGAHVVTGKASALN